MEADRTIYVLDTNVLVDYVDIIPGVEGKQPHDPTIALDQAHVVIPSVVIRELSNFKTEKTDRGKAAREVLRRLRRLVGKSNRNMEQFYNLKAPIAVKNCFEGETKINPKRLKELRRSKQQISILPVHKDFRESLPFYPADDDMDGQIILTALAVGMLQAERKIDGTLLPHYAEKTNFDNVVLVTNDNGLAIRARERGLKTERYGYKYPEPYTGRRDVIVPKELFLEFYNSNEIDVDIWDVYMADQPALVANEFIVMKLEDEADYPRDFDLRNDPYFSNIGRYDARDGTIVKLKHLREFPISLHNAGQAIYAEALMDPDIAAVICRGPAGSGKTYMATAYGLMACQNGDFIGVTVVPCDSKNDLGALPGDLDKKMDPEVQPLKNALRNYLLTEEPKFRKELNNLRQYGTNASENKKNKRRGDDEEAPGRRSLKARLIDRVDLIWDNWFSNIPIENARGRDFSYELAIFDEFQDQTASQADTLIKRLGCEGKIILAGDLKQIHAPYIDPSSSGLTYASRLLQDSPMVAQVCFTEDEVIRHALVKMVAKRQKSRKIGN